MTKITNNDATKEIFKNAYKKAKKYLSKLDLIKAFTDANSITSQVQRAKFYERAISHPNKFKLYHLTSTKIACIDSNGKTNWRSHDDIRKEFCKNQNLAFADSSAYGSDYEITEVDEFNTATTAEIMSSIMFPQFLPPTLCAKLLQDSMLSTAIAKVPSKIISTWIDIKYEKLIYDTSKKSFVNEYQKQETEKINANKSLINKELIKFNVQAILYDAVYKACGMGSCLIFIDNGDIDLTNPLIIDEYGIPKGSFKGFRIVENWQYTVVKSNWTKPLEPNYQQPEIYFIYNQYVHYSRCIMIKNELYPISTLYAQQYNYGSQSLIEKLLPFWRQYCTRMNITTDVQLKQNMTIYKTDAVNLQGAAGKVLIEELKQFQLIRDNFGVLAVDFERGEVAVEHYHMTEWSKLDADAFALIAVMLDIPQSKVAMTPPPGFNASGDFDEQAFNDKCDIFRRLGLTNPIEKILAVIKQNCLDEKEVQDYTWEFNKLHILTEQEAVLVLKEFAQSMTMLAKDAKALSPQDVRSLLIANYKLFGIMNEELPEDVLKDDPQTEQNI